MASRSVLRAHDAVELLAGDRSREACRRPRLIARGVRARRRLAATGSLTAAGEARWRRRREPRPDGRRSGAGAGAATTGGRLGAGAGAATAGLARRRRGAGALAAGSGSACGACRLVIDLASRATRRFVGGAAGCGCSARLRLTAAGRSADAIAGRRERCRGVLARGERHRRMPAASRGSGCRLPSAAPTSRLGHAARRAVVARRLRRLRAGLGGAASVAGAPSGSAPARCRPGNRSNAGSDVAHRRTLHSLGSRRQLAWTRPSRMIAP